MNADGLRSGAGLAGVPGGAFAARSVRAHAKVNLFLAIGAKRDDGYHEVSTVLQALDLADEVSVGPSAAGTTLERDTDLGIPPEEDVAYRAAESWRALSGYAGGIRISVRKRIPAGAGLGGGSADAAAVLWLLSGRKSPTDPIDEELFEAAASLGADVPFFLGPGTRLMTGRGDRFSDVLPTPELHLVLVNPGVPVPTGAAYARFDRSLMPPAPAPDAMLAAVREGSPAAIAGALYNNMTEASCALVPETAVALRFLRERDGLLGAAMAGSGSTVFGIFESPGQASEAARAAAEGGMWARATGTAASGVEE